MKRTTIFGGHNPVDFEEGKWPIKPPAQPDQRPGTCILRLRCGDWGGAQGVLSWRVKEVGRRKGVDGA